MTAEAYPLYWPEGWPRTEHPTRSRFECDFAKARQEVIWEVERMGGRYIVLSTNIPLRRDGLPLAGQKEPHDSGVAVYFQHKGKPRVFACDKWDRVRDNMRAIEKTIAAIRGIERWGASDMMERALSAFEALPAPGDWKSDLGLGSGPVTLDEARRKYREAVKTYHPDAGGNPEQFRRVNEAWERAQQELGQ